MMSLKNIRVLREKAVSIASHILTLELHLKQKGNETEESAASRLQKWKRLGELRDEISKTALCLPTAVHTFMTRRNVSKTIRAANFSRAGRGLIMIAMTFHTPGQASSWAVSCFCSTLQLRPAAVARVQPAMTFNKHTCNK